jgi:hypothetical protein
LDGDREPEDLSELVVPPEPIGEAVAAAGGGTGDPGERSLSAGLLGRVLSGVSAGRVVSKVLKALPGRLPQRRWIWDYGDPDDRHIPFVPHMELDGRSWGDEDERREKIGDFYPGDHPFCQCRIRRSWTIA